MVLPKYSRHLTLLAVLTILVLTVVHVDGQQAVTARAELLGAQSPYSFPEKMVAGPDRGLYFLDTSLSSIFFLDPRNRNVTRLCGPSNLSSPSDLAVDSKGSLWVLHSGGSKMSRLDRKCAAQGEISLSDRALRIAATSVGELIVLNETGKTLFSLFSTDGRLLRSFGERNDYKDEITNSELSDGRIAVDNSGGFFFSFNYPPLIRHYGRNGALISEFRPESDVTIAPPNITVRKLSNSFAVSAKYQILVLDMTTDGDRLYLLLSGKNKVPALNEGTPKLRVVTSKGTTVKELVLAHSFHRLAARDGALVLLRNRAPFRVDEYIPF